MSQEQFLLIIALSRPHHRHESDVANNAGNKA